MIHTTQSLWQTEDNNKKNCYIIYYIIIITREKRMEKKMDEGCQHRRKNFTSICSYLITKHHWVFVCWNAPSWCYQSFPYSPFILLQKSKTTKINFLHSVLLEHKILNFGVRVIAVCSCMCVYLFFNFQTMVALF